MFVFLVMIGAFGCVPVFFFLLLTDFVCQENSIKISFPLLLWLVPEVFTVLP